MQTKNKRFIRQAAAISGRSCAIAIIGLSSISLVSQASAATDVSTKRITQLNFQNAPVTQVLKTLFQSVGASYTIASDVQGTVNVSIADASFDTALKNILRSTTPPLTYDLTDNTYNVKVKKAEVKAVAVDPNAPDPKADATKKQWYKINVDSLDPAYVALLFAPGKATIIQPNIILGGGGQRGGGGGYGGGQGGQGGFGGGQGGFGGGQGGFGGGGGGFGGGGF